MKGNTKKFAVFAMIAAIAMFTVVAMASAKGIQGEYAVTGGATCIVAPLGFTNLVPNEPPAASGVSDVWAIQTGYWLGVFTFNRDGTGSLNALDYISLQPGSGFGIGTSPRDGSYSLQYKFTYTVTSDGVITFKLDPCTYTACSVSPTPCTSPEYLDNIPQTGVISPDGKSLIVHCGAAVTPINAYSACSDSTYSPTKPHAALGCNIALSGFKVPASFPSP
jgi:hypothetical protein